jgi:hypothetical protein
MPKINQVLQGNDLAFLRMVANGWEYDLTAPDAYTAQPLLVAYMRAPENIRRVFGSLPEEARAVLQSLLEHEGRIPWGQFTRQHGELRSMGPGKRDRERPDLHPVSPVEILWYHAMIGKAFFDLPPEAQEFAFIPEELLDPFSELCDLPTRQWGRPATPGETAHLLPASDAIIDRASSLLAAARIGLEMNAWKHFREDWPKGLTPFLRDLLYAAYLLDEQSLPMPENTRDFLVHSRGEALGLLAKRWMHSRSINEFRLVPDLSIAESVDNNPHGTRQKVLEILSQVPGDRWWNLNSFIEAVHEREPDFQRPGGNYDTWFIRETDSTEVLSGFASWQRVDGRLLRYLITGPMHWLGFFDLASDTPGGMVTAFRYSPWALELFSENAPKGLPEEDRKLSVRDQTLICLPVLAPRWLRYQVARFTDWVQITGAGDEREYQFRASPNSLKRAHAQGLKTSQLGTLLERWSETPLPEGFARALENWEQNGVQVSLQPALLVRIHHPEALEALKKSTAGHLILEQLNDTTLRIHPNAESEVISTLARLGYLVQKEQ